MHQTGDSEGKFESMDFANLVEQYYASLYRFALSLTRAEADACDLTQQTFYIWAAKGHQLRDPAKVKSWLFTTLHREFLEGHRHQSRFPEHELEASEAELPSISPAHVNEFDAAGVLQALGRVDQVFQAPVSLFYLEDYSYKEIAEILDVPIGTVKSRIARGLVQLQKTLADPASPNEAGKEFRG